MSSSKAFCWDGWQNGHLPALQEHNRAKPAIVDDYLQEYITIRCQNDARRRDCFRLLLVNGFAGGGVYAGGERGSPLVMLEAVRAAQKKLNADGRTKPLHLDVHYFFAKREKRGQPAVAPELVAQMEADDEARREIANCGGRRPGTPTPSIRLLHLLTVLLTTALALTLTGCELPATTEARRNQQFMAKVNADVAAKERTDQKRRDAYLSQHPEVTPAVRETISQGKLMVGMSYGEVFASIGKTCNTVHETHNASGTSVMLDFYDKYLFFNNGILSSWSTHS